MYTCSVCGYSNEKKYCVKRHTNKAFINKWGFCWTSQVSSECFNAPIIKSGLSSWFRP